jgi:hypothetical protein
VCLEPEIHCAGVELMVECSSLNDTRCTLGYFNHMSTTSLDVYHLQLHKELSSCTCSQSLKKLKIVNYGLPNTTFPIRGLTLQPIPFQTLQFQVTGTQEEKQPERSVCPGIFQATEPPKSKYLAEGGDTRESFGLWRRLDLRVLFLASGCAPSAYTHLIY